MVDSFYQRVLEDPLLAPVFLEVARIDLDQHLPLIAAYWKKMLLGDPAYDRHMIAKHRAVHDKQPLTGAHHERWLALFTANLRDHFSGPNTDRARLLAARVMDNLYRQLSRR
ncbi:MAG: group III truncated hemoglobin [Alcanivorax sp.]|nr:group III truncated hemoglobin [Alcanivorax sp.]